MIILTIATITLITIQTYNQYKKVTITANKKIAEIIGTIIKEEPEIDTRTIIETLNSKQDTEEYQKGQAELAKYGIDINETNSIILVQNQMRQNLISNIILIIVFSILWMIIIFEYLKRRDKKINQITQYINEIKNRKYDLDINENSEDELSNLKNELYKITVMLKEESEISKKDKDNLKMSVEDISHQLKTPLTSITIILAIPTMIASYWGMNVEVPMEFSHSPWAFYAVVIFSVILGIIAMIWLKKKDMLD